MLSVEECLQILNQKADIPIYSKGEAKEIRDYLYGVAEIDIENYKQTKNDTECDNV